VELYRIASEVGLPESHVRRALTEVRSDVSDGGVLDRLFGPASLRASRLVEGTSDELTAELDEFLVASRLLQPVRRGAGVLQYRPAVDWASQLARAASFTSRKYYVASAKSVEVHLERVDDERTLVDVRVEPGTRGDDIAGAVFVGGVGGGMVGSLTGLALASVIPLGPAVVLGIGAGAGVWSLIAWAFGRGHKKKLREVQNELEGVLDALETGAGLEPPPPSWRRWVKRHFHGVARDLMRPEDDV
jgi:hypothetical protein